jgi:magnesium transporter
MNYQDAIKKINKLLGLYKFNSYKIKENGNEIITEGDLAVGEPIYIINKDGQIPAPDGEFELDDTTKITIKDGLVQKINYDNKLDEKLLLRINENQDLTMSLREALFDKQRVLSSLLRNEDLMLDSYNRLRIIIKDINSLIEHANFNFTRLEYLQNSFLGLLNIEQNKVIKTFTVVSLVFMPPTLIASIYGMNFHLMPELSSEFGYPIALCLMFISSIIPLAIFKRKKWL